jgi:hypothetical protein
VLSAADVKMFELLPRFISALELVIDSWEDERVRDVEVEGGVVDHDDIVQVGIEGE